MFAKHQDEALIELNIGNLKPVICSPNPISCLLAGYYCCDD